MKLFEWNYVDVARECQEYLGPNGVDAVQIGPVTEHILGSGWYTKYQPVSFGLMSRSGTPEELRDMVAKCRQAGVEVMVDIVLNHQAYPCSEAAYPEEGMPCIGWNGTRFGNRKTAGARGWDHADFNLFHHNSGWPYFNCGVGPPDFLCTKYGLPDCTYCDMYGMPDWNTGLDEVRSMHFRHLKELHDMGVSMLRVDAAIYMSVDDLSSVLNRLPWDYVYQEWWGEYPPQDRTKYIGRYRDVEYRWKVTNALATLEAERLPEIINVQSGVFGIEPDMSVYPITFMDGRSDQADRTTAIYKNGLEYHQQQKFFLAWPAGVSIVLWGGFGWTHLEQGPPGCEDGDDHCVVSPVFFEGSPECMDTPTQSPLPVELANQRGWVCEHRWEGVAGLIGFRKSCRTLPMDRVWSSASTDEYRVGLGRLAWTLGDSCFAALVKGPGFDAEPDVDKQRGWPLSGLKVGLPPGRYCDVASRESRHQWDGYSCPHVVEIDQNGFIVSGYVREGDLLAVHTGAVLADL